MKKVLSDKLPSLMERINKARLLPQTGRAIGKSRKATEFNREINFINLSIHARFKDILERTGKVTATDVKNAFQGIASHKKYCSDFLMSWFGNFICGWV